MPRNPKKIVPGRNNKLWMRIEVPEVFLLLAKRLEATTGRKQGDGVMQIIHEVAASLLRGRSTFLGPELADLVPEVARQLRFEREVKESQEITVDGKPIDFAILHTNPKLKSGFVGVFGNGQGFRAMGKDPVTTGALLIGYYPTALEAAWARYVYHQKHDLPYGPWSEIYEKHRMQYPHETVYDSKAFCAWTAGCGKYPAIGIPDEFMRFYNGEMPMVSKASIDPDPDDIAAINAKAAVRMREIAAEKKAKAEAARAPKATQAGKLASPDELEEVDRQIAKSVGPHLELNLQPPDDLLEDEPLTEDEIMANARML